MHFGDSQESPGSLKVSENLHFKLDHTVFLVIYETRVQIVDHDMKTWESNEGHGKAETLSLSNVLEQDQILELVFHMTSQSQGQTGEQVLFSIMGLIIQMVTQLFTAKLINFEVKDWNST